MTDHVSRAGVFMIFGTMLGYFERPDHWLADALTVAFVALSFGLALYHIWRHEFGD